MLIQLRYAWQLTFYTSGIYSPKDSVMAQASFWRNWLSPASVATTNLPESPWLLPSLHFWTSHKPSPSSGFPWRWRCSWYRAGRTLWCTERVACFLLCRLTRGSSVWGRFGAPGQTVSCTLSMPPAQQTWCRCRWRQERHFDHLPQGDCDAMYRFSHSEGSRPEFRVSRREVCGENILMRDEVSHVRVSKKCGRAGQPFAGFSPRIVAS